MKGEKTIFIISSGFCFFALVFNIYHLSNGTAIWVICMDFGRSKLLFLLIILLTRVLRLTITLVLGPPWSIPIEFPLYQWNVAAAVKIFNTPLDQTGRFFSCLLFW